MKRARVYLLAAIVIAAIWVVPTEAAWLYPGYGYNLYGFNIYSFYPHSFYPYSYYPYGFNPYGFSPYGFYPYVPRPYHYWNYGYNYDPRGYRSYNYGYGYDPYGYGPYSYGHYRYHRNPRPYEPQPDSFYTQDWHETDDAFTNWYDASGQRQEAGQPSQQQQPDRAAVPQEAPISGTVRDTIRIRLAGQDQDHLFARIDTAQGQSIVADLGPVNGVDRLDLSQGDPIRISGRPAIVNGRPVLMAETVTAGDQTIQVPTVPGAQTQRLEGTITNIMTRGLEGGPRPPRLVATVRLETGQMVPVDLGPPQNLRDASIEIGSEVVILARPVPRGSRTIFIAESLSIAGKQIDIRPLPQHRPQLSQQQAGDH